MTDYCQLFIPLLMTSLKSEKLGEMRKPILIFLFLIHFGLSAALGANMQNHNVRLHQQITSGPVKLEFSKIIADSRCPQNEDCYWPGIFVAEVQVMTEDQPSYVGLLEIVKVLKLINRGKKKSEVPTPISPRASDPAYEA